MTKRQQRESYHHGDLRAALIQAADDLIREGGLEAFSLRAAAKRAGVSAAAPGHHFSSVNDLLTEVALQGFHRLDVALNNVQTTGDPTADIRALALSYIRFAVANPGLFRLMYRGDLVNRDDPRYPEVSHRSGMRLTRTASLYKGRSEADIDRFEDAALMLSDLAALQGLATFVLEKKAIRFFKGFSPRDFNDEALPKILEVIYPERV